MFWWITYIWIVVGSVIFSFYIQSGPWGSKAQKNKEDSNLPFLSDEDYARNLILLGISVVACFGAFNGEDAGIRGATLVGWFIGAGLSPLITGSFLWVISLIWTKPKLRMLRLRQTVLGTTIFYMVGLWANWLYNDFF